MRLTVRMFGALAEAAGGDRDVVEVPDGGTAADVVDAIGIRHGKAAGILPRLRVAVNLEVVPPERRIVPGDEVALLPPVAGGAAILVGLREAPSVDEALDAVAGPEAGGTAAFVGTVRGEHGRVDRLVYSAYAEMAERVLGDIALEAVEKWTLHGVAILHGAGDLAVGQRTVVIACAAAHRDDAFEACRYVIDEVKRRAPIWKVEIGPRGRRWVGLE